MTHEQITKRQICEWLERKGALFTLHIRSRGKYNATKYAKNGWPDIHGVWRDGKALLIEVKAPEGTISKQQYEIIELARSMGAHAMVVYSCEDVIKALERPPESLK